MTELTDEWQRRRLTQDVYGLWNFLVAAARRDNDNGVALREALIEVT